MTRSSGRLALHDAAVASPHDGASAAAHAKVILLGEHAVVHGGPAIALPVHELRLTASVRRTDGPLCIDSVLHTGTLSEAPAALAAPATAITETLALLGARQRGLTVRIDGEIPAERGLGSSAAVAAAISAAVARGHDVQLDAEAHFALVQAAERVAHGTPSGLDARSVIAPTPIWFRRGEVQRLRVAIGTVFVIADTGITGGTRQAVADVAALKAADEPRTTGILRRIDEHTAAAVDDLAADRRESLGERMFTVHDLLRELTVSSPELDRLVAAARAAGALGAKLTGGGRGGCVVAMASDVDHAGRLAAALRAAGAVNTWMLQPEDLAA